MKLTLSFFPYEKGSRNNFLDVKIDSASIAKDSRDLQAWLELMYLDIEYYKDSLND
jgi:hypothetical protein